MQTSPVVEEKEIFGLYCHFPPGMCHTPHATRHVLSAEKVEALTIFFKKLARAVCEFVPGLAKVKMYP